MRKPFLSPDLRPTPKSSENLTTALLVGLVLALSTVATPAGRERIDGWMVVVGEALHPTPRAVRTPFSRNASLTAEQARAAQWIAKRYRISQRATQDIVTASFEAAQQAGIDPYLLLAVISVESAFNPLAESSVGAAGLMQVMPEVHRNRFDNFGGMGRALDPTVNIRVGAGILREYISRFKSEEAALAAYVGVGPDGVTDYPNRVQAMRSKIRAAGQGRVLA